MNSKPRHTVAEVLTKHIDNYTDHYGKLTSKQNKVVNHITQCKTALQGGHAYSCTTCGDTIVTYNSCRDRHCPKCQGISRASWVNDRVDELLPVGYFHVVFTLPHEINPFALRNKKVVYDILFRSVSETITTLCKDPRWLGGTPGAIAVLHTWGQNLLDHPHVHCIIPAGGIRNDNKKWVSFKNNYFIAVEVLSELYKGKFLDYFKTAIQQKQIVLHGSLSCYTDQKLLKSFFNIVWKKKWVVYVKEPFASPECVVKYLGRYTHRIAIADQRIVAVDDHKVMFKWKDYADNDRQKIMAVEPQEFIRRFLLHVLPDRYTRIRYFGFLSNSRKSEKLEQCCILLQKRYEKKLKRSQKIVDLFLDVLNVDVTKCRQCEDGHYALSYTYGRTRAGP